MRVKKVRINSAAAAAILQSARVEADLLARGQRIAEAAGPGVDVDSKPSRDRAAVIVTTATREARLAEAEDRALSRALDAGR